MWMELLHLFTRNTERMNKSEFQNLLQNTVDASVQTNTKRYWLVRTDDGANYETFSSENFIALNLRDFPVDFIRQASGYETPKERIQTIKECLIGLHRQEKVLLPYNQYENSYSSNMGRLAGHIDSIALEMKYGDIVLIPSQGAERLKIGKIVDADLTTDENITRIFSFARKVEWIKEISKKRLEANLYRALGAHQAVCDITRYASVIERNYTSYFVIEDNYHYVLTINAESVSAFEITALVQNVLSTVERISTAYDLGINVRDVKFSININSPGKMDFISTGKNVILTMAVVAALAGGTITYGKLELQTNGLFNSLIEAVNEWKNAEQEREQRQKLFDQYQQSLDVKSVENWNAMVDEEENS